MGEYCLSPLCLFLILGFCVTPLFGTYFSVSSFCLILCLYFSVLSKLCTLTLEKWLYVGDLQWGRHHTPLESPELCAPSIPVCGLCGPFFCSRADYSGCTGRQDWPPAGWLPSSVLVVASRPLVGGSGSLCIWLLSPWGPRTVANPRVSRYALGIYRLERGLQSGHCQPCILVKWAPQMAASNICVPRGNSTCFCLSGSLFKINKWTDPVSFQITASVLGLRAYEMLCTPSKSGLSVSFGPPSNSPLHKHDWPSRGLSSYWKSPQPPGWGAQCEVQTPCSLGRILLLWLSCCLWVTYPG